MSSQSLKLPARTQRHNDDQPLTSLTANASSTTLDLYLYLPATPQCCKRWPRCCTVSSTCPSTAQRCGIVCIRMPPSFARLRGTHSAHNAVSAGPVWKGWEGRCTGIVFMHLVDSSTRFEIRGGVQRPKPSRKPSQSHAAVQTHEQRHILSLSELQNGLTHSLQMQAHLSMRTTTTVPTTQLPSRPPHHMPSPAAFKTVLQFA